MPTRSTRRARSAEPSEHVSAAGFRWRIVYPERAAAVIGARKPLATIECSSVEEDGCAGSSDVLRVPVAVARALDASDAPEPESRAELLYRVREALDTCAWARVVDMAARREYAAGEAAERLRRDGFGRACAERVIERAQKARIISDARFADSFIRSKLACGWGPVRIERELRQRGVEPAEVAGWPDEYLGDDTVEQRALELLRARRIPEKNAYPKLVRFLASRGYALSVAKDAASARLAEVEEDVD